MPAKRDPVLRFIERVRRAESGPFVSGVYCLEWTGHCSRQTGYGQIGLSEPRRMLMTTHRFAYATFIRSVPVGMHVLHKCDNRKCCEPAHLFLGTQRDNVLDMHAKGRDRNGDHRGSKNAAATIDEPTAVKIAEMCRTHTRADVARALGVHKGVVWDVANGTTWAHVTGISAPLPRPPRLACRNGHDLTAPGALVGTHCFACRKNTWTRHNRKRLAEQRARNAEV